MKRVTVHPSLILWLSLLGYVRPRLVLPFLAAVILHELGHILALCLLEKPPVGLHLSFFGARLTTPPLSYREELLSAAAGPAASLLLGLSLPVMPYFACYSLILGCFNLLPTPGLDGGRMLESALLLTLAPEPAFRICRFFAMLTALSLWGGAVYLSCAARLGLWPMIPAALFLVKALMLERPDQLVSPR